MRIIMEVAESPLLSLRPRARTILTERDPMRHLTLAIAACFLAACATARTTQVTAQAPERPVAACEAGAPLYVVDGVRSCAKP